MFKKIFLHKTQSLYIQMFRFLFVGGFSTVVDIGLFTVLNHMLPFRDSVNLNVATFIGFVGGFTINYILSGLWVFQSKKGLFSTEFYPFLVVALIGLGLNFLVINVLIYFGILSKAIFMIGLSAQINGKKVDLLAKCIATAIAMIWNFVARKVFVYKHS